MVSRWEWEFVSRNGKDGFPHSSSDFSEVFAWGQVSSSLTSILLLLYTCSILFPLKPGCFLSSGKLYNTLKLYSPLPELGLNTKHPLRALRCWQLPIVTWGASASISQHCSQDAMSKRAPGVHDTHTAGGQMGMNCERCWLDIVYFLSIILQQAGDQWVHCWKCGQCPLVEWEVVVGRCLLATHQFAPGSAYHFLSQVSKTCHVSLPNTELSFTSLLLPWPPDLLRFSGFAASRTMSGGKFDGTSRSKNSSPEEITQIIPEFMAV